MSLTAYLGADLPTSVWTSMKTVLRQHDCRQEPFTRAYWTASKGNIAIMHAIDKIDRRFVIAGLGAVATSIVSGCDTKPVSSPEIDRTVHALRFRKPNALIRQDAALFGSVVQSGDSIAVGQGADNWAAIEHLGFGERLKIYNISAGGRSMAEGFAIREEIPKMRSDIGPSVLIIQQGTNDLGLKNDNGENLYANIATPFVAWAKDAGFYVLINTIMPRQDYGWNQDKEKDRLIYNNLVRDNGAKADAINDLATDPLIGDDASPVESALFFDALHLTMAGQKHLATLIAASVRPLLQMQARPVIAKSSSQDRSI